MKFLVYRFNILSRSSSISVTIRHFSTRVMPLGLRKIHFLQFPGGFFFAEVAQNEMSLISTCRVIIIMSRSSSISVTIEQFSTHLCPFDLFAASVYFLHGCFLGRGHKCFKNISCLIFYPHVNCFQSAHSLNISTP